MNEGGQSTARDKVEAGFSRIKARQIRGIGRLLRFD